MPPPVSQSPAYLMYPDDILASGRVSSLEPLEELWYRRAIDLGWKNGGMPADPGEFAGWVGRGCTVEAAAKIIAKLYVPHKKDSTKVVNERQEKERKLFFKKRKKKSDAGKLGMAKRWNKKSKDDNTVITEDNIPIPISIPSISTSNEVEKEREEKPKPAPLTVAPKRNTHPSSHPAVIAVRVHLKNPPDPATYPEIIAALGQKPDLGRLSDCYREWVKRGFKAENLAWALEWYVSGIPENTRGKSNGTHQQPAKSNVVAIEQSQEYFDRKYGSGGS